MLSCEPSELAELAKCFAGLTRDQREGINTYLLALIAGEDPDPDALSEAAKCFDGIPINRQRAIQIKLLCDILNT